MASIDDIINQLEWAKDRVGQAIQALQGAEAEADELQGQMAAAGVRDKVEAFAGVKDTIERASVRLAAGVDLVDEATTEARAASG